ncbi:MULTISPECIES: CDP-glycerol glycerophosphotransferase family protein [unclassified Agrococcus]|uniref:CDP-glycerol glycerophosphotransferase family protein n=1 Tax=unclassified Agrococcus TaxID=2615065 RepID=UPI003616292F
MRTLLALPAVALGAAASLVVARDRRRWVVGCGSGVGEGALPLALAAQARGDDVAWVVRSDRDAADAERHGLRTVRGWAAFTATLRAGVVVITHGFGDVSRAGVHGAYVVHLWHGIPLKHLHRDAPGWLRIAGVPDVAPVRRLLREAHRRSASRIRLLPVASERAASRIRSALGIDAEVVRVLGDARVDVLADADAPGSRAAASALLDRSGARGRATVLYAPTWRDGKADPAVPTADEWGRIAAWLDAHDARLVVRSHPHGLGDYATGAATSERIGLLGHDVLADVTPALPGVDLLVTDFSSIGYDAATLGIPTLLLAPDVAAYAASRGLYDRYDAFSGGRHERTWDALLAWASEVAAPGEARDERLAHARVLVAEHVRAFGGSTQRVLQAIDAALGHGDAPSEPEATAAIRAIWRDGEALRMRIDPGTARPVAVRLRSARELVHGELTRGALATGAPATGEVVEAAVPLTRSRWGGPALVLPSDAWVVEVVDASGARLELAPPATVPQPELALDARIAFEPREGSVAVVLSPPLTDAERAPGAQRALQRAHLGSPTPQQAVMLEAFYGTAASCNPAGIDRALAARLPHVVRAWSTVDGSVPIPEGSVRVVEGSEAWWRLRGGARALVVNDWLRKRHRRMRHQRVVQTWHGTPLKRLALERDGQGLRTRIASVLEGRRWDVLLAQNPFAAEHLRAAYRFRGPVWELGYPRGDVLRTGDRDAVRARLDVPLDARVALYAPTWRDDRVAVVDHVDVAALAARLGPGWRVVVRGHARATAQGALALVGEGVVDATTYPDVAELLVAADVLVTDYSSVMFDAAGIELPTVFAVPDLDDYRDRLRGFTFDLAEVAPGPFARTLDEVVDAVLAAGPGDGWEARRVAWRERFAPLDDGHAGERVVERMLADGILDEAAGAAER